MISTNLCANDNYTIYDADKLYCSNDVEIAVAYKHLVIYLDSLYQCQWYSRGHIPGEAQVWKLTKECNPSNITDICARFNHNYTYTIYDYATVYCFFGTEYVKYNNSIYMCLYWTQREIPGVDKVWYFKKNCSEFSNTGFYTTDADDILDDNTITSPTRVLTILVVIYITTSLLF